MENRYNRDKIFCSKRKAREMNKFHTTFLGYRIYRRKFSSTIAVVLFLSILVFAGMLIFFVNTWMTDLRQQAQNRFLDRESRMAVIRNWTLNYTNGLYEDSMLMKDLKVLFYSSDQQQYLWGRREDSLTSSEQIRYLPANLRQLFTDSRSEITGVTLRSESGMKSIWMENGDVRLSFEFHDAQGLRQIPGFGDILVASFSIRDPAHMSESMGVMDFWISSSELYEGDEGFRADWGVFDLGGVLLASSALSGDEEQRLAQVNAGEQEEGWLSGTVYCLKFVSSQADYTFVVIRDLDSVLRDNVYVVAALSLALSLIAFGVILTSYVGMRTDATFLTTIMTMLGAVESGDFKRLKMLELPVRHRENEYGMIAVALKDVGVKLEGYIETEYIWKLKEQETEMRALQHQINPHFLFNTLETLRSKALLQGDRDMADAIAMLGSLYRARIHWKNSISLKEEFSLLEMYLKIMELRFRNNFVYQIELEREIEEIPTVNFWLQPLAENFFTHGFDRESEYNLLIVSGYQQNGGARIELIDNGRGVSARRLEEIRKNMYEGNDEPEADIGLRNVYMRLNYFYKEGFEMDIGNNPEGGFFISIFIPGKVVEDVHPDDRG